MTSEFSSAGTARAPWSACPDRWINFPVVGGEPDERVNPTRQTRLSASLQALALPHSRRGPPWCRRPLWRGVSSVHLFLGEGAFQAQGGTH